MLVKKGALDNAPFLHFFICCGYLEHALALFIPLIFLVYYNSKPVKIFFARVIL